MYNVQHTLSLAIPDGRLDIGRLGPYYHTPTARCS